MEINLQELQREKKEILEFLARPEAFSETGFAEKSRRLNEVTEILELVQELKRAEENLAVAEEMRGDAELAEMAEEDITRYSAEKSRLEAELEEKLLPRDPDDDKPAIVEIRAGAGGDEASLFAGEIYRMYLHYAEKNGLKTEQISINENEVGGVKEVICRISGDDAYGKMKFEGGVHRVQRVPVTESQGRIHTSTVTVAVLSEMEERDLEINPDDLRIDIYRSGGHGGQGVNTTDSAVRITHLPTGIVVAMQDERSQQQNRVKAMTILRARLAEKKKEEEVREASAERKSLIGTGDRSEKIRTYNFPQDRVTDHRIHYSRSNIMAVMNGEIEDIVSELKKSEREFRENEVSGD